MTDPPGEVRYGPIGPEHAALLFDWRRRPEITRFMFSDITDDFDRHCAWVTAAAERVGFVHRLILLDHKPVGYCSITVTDPDAAIGSIGVYIVDRAARTGNAGFNFIHLANHAFFRLGLQKIENQIMGANARLVRAQAFNGYREVGVLRRHHLKYGTLWDVHLFEMLREDWLAFRRRFGDWRDLDGTEHPDPTGE